MTGFIQRFTVLFSALLVVMIMLGAFIPVSGENAVYTDTLRLHVLANSDSDEDQALKLKVRDAVLEVMRGLAFEHEITDADDATEIVSGNMHLIENAARAVIGSEGYDYPVSVEICREYFPTREYDVVRLPAGEYRAVRILIGSASGQNWWCVLYPTLCLDAAEPARELAEAGFTRTQIRLLTDSEAPRYVLRFRFLEWAAELKNRLAG